MSKNHMHVIGELRQQIGNLKADLEAEKWRRRRCSEENEELRTRNERLRSALQKLVDEAAHLAGFSENTEREVVRVLNENPTQQIREGKE